MREGAAERSHLENLIPLPGILEEDHVDLEADPGTVWERIHHFVLRALGGRYGDNRNWPDIEAWADKIARSLGEP